MARQGRQRVFGGKRRGRQGGHRFRVWPRAKWLLTYCKKQNSFYGLFARQVFKAKKVYRVSLKKYNILVISNMKFILYFGNIISGKLL